MNWIKPDWPAPTNIHAAVTLRAGGISNGQFSSLNLADHVNDNPNHVKSNRETVGKLLKLPADPVWLQQVHGNHVIKAENIQPIVQAQADASYTNQPQTVCAVLTADCLPILLTDTKGSTIAAIHGGWKSLLAGVVANTVNAMGTIDLIAWFGPAIGATCFEVGEDVHTLFTTKNSAFNDAFTAHNEKFLLDIYQLATIELASLGIAQVFGGNYCTVTDSERFYSYRRDGETGRMATLIWRD